jgi:hypothetical protein
MTRGGWVVVLLLWVGCATPRVVHLETGAGRRIDYTPVESRPVEIDEAAFRQAITRLLLETRLEVSLRESHGRSLLASAGGLVDGVRAAGRDAPETRLRLLDSPMDRRMTALSFAFDTVWEGVEEAVGELADPAVLRGMVVSMVGTAMVMLVAPEPITKLAALVLTASLVAYLGTGPVWNLGQGFLALMHESEDARDLAELEAVGHRFGRVLGSNGARVLVIVAMTAMGGRSALASQGPRMPGFAQAASRARLEGGYELAEVFAGGVRSLSIPEAGVLNVALAPTAVAAVAMGPGGGGIQGDPEGEVHHICTDKNEVSEASGGPWTPQFERYFKQARMDLNDAANKVRIDGHRGPHPREYHQEVLERISKAMLGCRGATQCRAALVDELAKIAKDLVTEGTRLRKLVTNGSRG